MFRYLAIAYGQGNYNTTTYSSDAPLTTTAPGAPNTGFFQSVMPGQNELWLIPAILVVAVIIAASVVGIKKFIRAHKA